MVAIGISSEGWVRLGEEWEDISLDAPMSFRRGVLLDDAMGI